MNSDILLAYLESALCYFLSLILIQFHKITFLFKKQLILKQPIPRHLLFPAYAASTTAAQQHPNNLELQIRPLEVKIGSIRSEQPTSEFHYLEQDP